MIREAVDCHQFGDLAVRSTRDDAFEIVHLREDGAAIAIARVEVDESEFPTLKITKLEPSERALETAATICIDHAILSSRKGDHSTCFELTVKGKDGGLEIVLSGDHRTMAGDRHFRLFWWRAECRLENGETLVHGPFLASDLDS